MKLSKCIRFYRKRQILNQEHLANKIHVSRKQFPV